MPNQGGQQQQFPQSSGPAGMAPQARPPQSGPSQPFVNQYAPPPLGGVERRVEQQEDKSSSVKKSESMGTSDFGDSVTIQRVKEESKDGALDHSPGGK